MISVAEAMRCLKDAIPLRPAETIALEQASGRILAAPINADRDQPPFDRVMMDGIALDADTYQSGRNQFSVQGTQAAGASTIRLADKKQCIEVMTGAVLPT
ncbi:MAG: molybdopterin molybdenumtransferase MoeA, partial [Gammaproteobacteria bacterium]|nr:molybdopterin molybdenumtransferase MoeA [Gammaproteobacteria bacterium]